VCLRTSTHIQSRESVCVCVCRCLCVCNSLRISTHILSKCLCVCGGGGDDFRSSTHILSTMPPIADFSRDPVLEFHRLALSGKPCRAC
jgi:hypothetical protein